MKTYKEHLMNRYNSIYWSEESLIVTGLKKIEGEKTVSRDNSFKGFKYKEGRAIFAFRS